MAESDPLKMVTQSRFPFPLRVLMSAFPVMVVMLPVLWLTGYPPEEWPFVSGVFALSLIGSGTLVSYVAGLIVKRLHRYAREVAVRLGIDSDQFENQTPDSHLVRIIGTLVPVILLALAAWGLSLYVLAFVMEQMEMLPVGTHFSSIAMTILVIGAGGFASFVGSLAWFFRTVDRDPQQIRRLSRLFRSWLNVAGDMGRPKGFSGAPSLTGNNPLT